MEAMTTQEMRRAIIDKLRVLAPAHAIRQLIAEFVAANARS